MEEKTEQQKQKNFELRLPENIPFQVVKIAILISFGVGIFLGVVVGAYL